MGSRSFLDRFLEKDVTLDSLLFDGALKEIPLSTLPGGKSKGDGGQASLPHYLPSLGDEVGRYVTHLTLSDAIKSTWARSGEVLAAQGADNLKMMQLRLKALGKVDDGMQQAAAELDRLLLEEGQKGKLNDATLAADKAEAESVQMEDRMLEFSVDSIVILMEHLSSSHPSMLMQIVSVCETFVRSLSPLDGLKVKSIQSRAGMVARFCSFLCKIALEEPVTGSMDSNFQISAHMLSLVFRLLPAFPQANLLALLLESIAPVANSSHARKTLQACFERADVRDALRQCHLLSSALNLLHVPELSSGWVGLHSQWESFQSIGCHSGQYFVLVAEGVIYRTPELQTWDETPPLTEIPNALAVCGVSDSSCLVLCPDQVVLASDQSGTLPVDSTSLFGAFHELGPLQKECTTLCYDGSCVHVVLANKESSSLLVYTCFLRSVTTESDQKKFILEYKTTLELSNALPQHFVKLCSAVCNGRRLLSVVRSQDTVHTLETCFIQKSSTKEIKPKGRCIVLDPSHGTLTLIADKRVKALLDDRWVKPWFAFPLLSRMESVLETAFSPKDPETCSASTLVDDYLSGFTICLLHFLWYQKQNTTSSCSPVVVESRHPYENDHRSVQPVHFPGASSIEVTFDEKSRTESGCDYVCFYTDEGLSQRFPSGTKYSGRKWPGVAGIAPLVIPGSKVWVQFTTDSSVNDWGFKAYLKPKISSSAVDSGLPVESMKSLVTHYLEPQGASMRLSDKFCAAALLTLSLGSPSAPKLSPHHGGQESDESSSITSGANAFGHSLLGCLSETTLFECLSDESLTLEIRHSALVCTIQVLPTIACQAVFDEFLHHVFKLLGSMSFAPWQRQALVDLVAASLNSVKFWNSISKNVSSKMLHKVTLNLAETIGFCHEQSPIDEAGSAIGLASAQPSVNASSNEIMARNEGSLGIQCWLLGRLLLTFQSRVAHSKHASAGHNELLELFSASIAFVLDQSSKSLEFVGETTEPSLIEHRCESMHELFSLAKCVCLMAAISAPRSHTLISMFKLMQSSISLCRLCPVWPTSDFQLPTVTTFESPHPYRNNMHTRTSKSFPGASFIVIEFDGRTKMENRHDYIRFYSDQTFNKQVGQDKYTGSDSSSKYPGAGGEAPLRISGSEFSFEFVTDSSNTDWGYKFNATAVYPESTNSLASTFQTAIFATSQIASEAVQFKPAVEENDAAMFWLRSPLLRRGLVDIQARDSWSRAELLRSPALTPTRSALPSDVSPMQLDGGTCINESPLDRQECVLNQILLGSNIGISAIDCLLVACGINHQLDFSMKGLRAAFTGFMHLMGFEPYMEENANVFLRSVTPQSPAVAGNDAQHSPVIAVPPSMIASIDGFISKLSFVFQELCEKLGQQQADSLLVSRGSFLLGLMPVFTRRSELQAFDLVRSHSGAAFSGLEHLPTTASPQSTMGSGVAVPELTRTSSGAGIGSFFGSSVAAPEPSRESSSSGTGHLNLAGSPTRSNAAIGRSRSGTSSSFAASKRRQGVQALTAEICKFLKANVETDLLKQQASEHTACAHIRASGVELLTKIAASATHPELARLVAPVIIRSLSNAFRAEDVSSHIFCGLYGVRVDALERLHAAWAELQASIDQLGDNFPQLADVRWLLLQMTCVETRHYDRTWLARRSSSSVLQNSIKEALHATMCDSQFPGNAWRSARAFSPNGTLLVHGGLILGESRNEIMTCKDIWAMEPAGLHWAKLDTDFSTSRVCHSITWLDDCSAVFFGGYDDSGKPADTHYVATVDMARNEMSLTPFECKKLNVIDAKVVPLREIGPGHFLVCLAKEDDDLKIRNDALVVVSANVTRSGDKTPHKKVMVDIEAQELKTRSPDRSLGCCSVPDIPDQVLFVSMSEMSYELTVIDVVADKVVRTQRCPFVWAEMKHIMEASLCLIPASNQQIFVAGGQTSTGSTFPPCILDLNASKMELSTASFTKIVPPGQLCGYYMPSGPDSVGHQVILFGASADRGCSPINRPVVIKTMIERGSAAASRDLEELAVRSISVVAAQDLSYSGIQMLSSAMHEMMRSHTNHANSRQKGQCAPMMRRQLDSIIGQDCILLDQSPESLVLEGISVSQPVTIGLWIQISQASAADGAAIPIFSVGCDGRKVLDVKLIFEACRCHVRAKATSVKGLCTVVSSATHLLHDQWTHIAVCLHPGIDRSVQLYLDGLLDAHGTIQSDVDLSSLSVSSQSSDEFSVSGMGNCTYSLRLSDGVGCDPTVRMFGLQYAQASHTPQSWLSRECSPHLTGSPEQEASEAFFRRCLAVISQWAFPSFVSIVRENGLLDGIVWMLFHGDASYAGLTVDMLAKLLPELTIEELDTAVSNAGFPGSSFSSVVLKVVSRVDSGQPCGLWLLAEILTDVCHCVMALKEGHPVRSQLEAKLVDMLDGGLKIVGQVHQDSLKIDHAGLISLSAALRLLGGVQVSAYPCKQAFLADDGDAQGDGGLRVLAVKGSMASCVSPSNLTGKSATFSLEQIKVSAATRGIAASTMTPAVADRIMAVLQSLCAVLDDTSFQNTAPIIQMTFCRVLQCIDSVSLPPATKVTMDAVGSSMLRILLPMCSNADSKPAFMSTILNNILFQRSQVVGGMRQAWKFFEPLGHGSVVNGHSVKLSGNLAAVAGSKPWMFADSKFEHSFEVVIPARSDNFDNLSDEGVIHVGVIKLSDVPNLSPVEQPSGFSQGLSSVLVAPGIRTERALLDTAHPGPVTVATDGKSFMLPVDGPITIHSAQKTVTGRLWWTFSVTENKAFLAGVVPSSQEQTASHREIQDHNGCCIINATTSVTGHRISNYSSGDKITILADCTTRKMHVWMKGRLVKVFDGIPRSGIKLALTAWNRGKFTLHEDQPDALVELLRRASQQGASIHGGSHGGSPLPRFNLSDTKSISLRPWKAMQASEAGSSSNAKGDGCAVSVRLPRQLSGSISGSSPSVVSCAWDTSHQSLRIAVNGNPVKDCILGISRSDTWLPFICLSRSNNNSDDSMHTGCPSDEIDLHAYWPARFMRTGDTKVSDDGNAGASVETSDMKYLRRLQRRIAKRSHWRAKATEIAEEVFKSCGPSDLPGLLSDRLRLRLRILQARLRIESRNNADRAEWFEFLLDFGSSSRVAWTAVQRNSDVNAAGDYALEHLGGQQSSDEEGWIAATDTEDEGCDPEQSEVGTPRAGASQQSAQSTNNETAGVGSSSERLMGHEDVQSQKCLPWEAHKLHGSVELSNSGWVHSFCHEGTVLSFPKFLDMKLAVVLDNSGLRAIYSAGGLRFGPGMKPLSPEDKDASSSQLKLSSDERSDFDVVDFDALSVRSFGSGDCCLPKSWGKEVSEEPRIEDGIRYNFAAGSGNHAFGIIIYPTGTVALVCDNVRIFVVREISDDYSPVVLSSDHQNIKQQESLAIPDDDAAANLVSRFLPRSAFEATTAESQTLSHQNSDSWSTDNVSFGGSPSKVRHQLAKLLKVSVAGLAGATLQKTLAAIDRVWLSSLWEGGKGKDTMQIIVQSLSLVDCTMDTQASASYTGLIPVLEDIETSNKGTALLSRQLQELLEGPALHCQQAILFMANYFGVWSSSTAIVSPGLVEATAHVLASKSVPKAVQSAALQLLAFWAENVHFDNWSACWQSALRRAQCLAFQNKPGQDICASALQLMVSVRMHCSDVSLMQPIAFPTEEHTDNFALLWWMSSRFLADNASQRQLQSSASEVPCLSQMKSVLSSLQSQKSTVLQLLPGQRKDVQIFGASCAFVHAESADSECPDEDTTLCNSHKWKEEPAELVVSLNGGQICVPKNAFTVCSPFSNGQGSDIRVTVTPIFSPSVQAFSQIALNKLSSPLSAWLNGSASIDREIIRVLDEWNSDKAYKQSSADDAIVQMRSSPMLATLDDAVLRVRLEVLQSMSKLIKDVITKKPAILNSGLALRSSLTSKLPYIAMATFKHHRLGILKNLRASSSSSRQLTVVLSRARASRARCADGVDDGRSLFAQLMKCVAQSSRKTLQATSRPFKVVFAEEQGLDAGGLFRELFSSLANELQSARLPLLVRTSQAENRASDSEGGWALSPTCASSDRGRRLLRFFGNLIGSAICCKEPLNLDLSPCVWWQLCGGRLSCRERDHRVPPNGTALAKVGSISQMLEYGKETFDEVVGMGGDFSFSVQSLDGTPSPLGATADGLTICFDNAKTFVARAERFIEEEQMGAVRCVLQGIEDVVPRAAFQCLGWSLLEESACGKKHFTASDLKPLIDYRSGLSESSPSIEILWQVLEGFDKPMLGKFLRFVTGRSRLLPQNRPGESLNTNISIRQLSVSGNPDNYLPRAATCSFSLEWPAYNVFEAAKTKLEYAILNCDEIDGDGGYAQGYGQMEESDNDEEDE